jgi:hypothetical protein
VIRDTASRPPRPAALAFAPSEPNWTCSTL